LLLKPSENLYQVIPILLYFAANADETLEALLEIAEKLGRSPAQVALRWTLEQPSITSAIVGARNVEQLQDNLQAAQFRLEGEALQRLNEVSCLPDRYPEAMEKHMYERRNNAVKMPS
jgi:aryl-alcohol dehydrogenase-like predicted oxidoreductase